MGGVNKFHSIYSVLLCLSSELYFTYRVVIAHSLSEDIIITSRDIAVVAPSSFSQSKMLSKDKQGKAEQGKM